MHTLSAPTVGHPRLQQQLRWLLRHDSCIWVACETGLMALHQGLRLGCTARGPSKASGGTAWRCQAKKKKTSMTYDGPHLAMHAPCNYHARVW
eukprot:83910-Chlamydomonas_euryale.AAC.4